MTDMGTPANGFRKPAKPRPEEARKAMTIREAVARYGDNWRLMFPDRRFVRREHMEERTFDDWEAFDMVRMERGERSRIRVEDIEDGSHSERGSSKG